ncbi:MAG: hypothetical protein JO000_20750, partial [Alphaproteobacteria bacterium]|nr:hypothetical protein [Alphaproteobacteria bacterium]
LARPESLLYFLAALLVWVLALDLPLMACMAAGGIIIGFGTAVKISFASLAVLAVIPLTGNERARSARHAAAACCTFALAAVAGFCLAAPYAVVHYDTFLAGLHFLAEQYRGGHPPHSLTEYSFGGQALWIVRYFLELYGPLCLIALAAPLWLTGRLRLWAVALAGSWLILAVFFATQSVFFERNLAHALVPLLLAAAIGASALEPVWVRWAAGLAMLIPMAYWSSQIALTMKSAPGWLRYEAAHQIAPSQRIDYKDIVDATIPKRCDSVAVVGYNDPWSERYVNALREAGYLPIGQYEGRFALLVTSTLHTYLDPNFHYFRCPPVAR